MKAKFYNISRVLLSVVIIINIIQLLTVSVFNIQEPRIFVVFDIIVCLVIFIDFAHGFYKASNKLDYIKGDFFEFLACIPFDLLLSPFLGADILFFIKLARGVLLVYVLFGFSGNFLKNTRLDEIFGILILIIIGSTLGLYLVDPAMNNIFDDLWFVIVSITTVGYGDITPTTIPGKVFSLVLLILGVFIFSAITGAISTYFMDTMLQEGTYHIRTLKEKVQTSEVELEKVNSKLDESNKKIDDLKEEIKELKEIIEKNS